MGRKRSNCEYWPWRDGGGGSPAAPAPAPEPELRLWARYDSRPLLKAKEPRGRAESDSRKRKCVVLLGGGAACWVSRFLIYCSISCAMLTIQCEHSLVVRATAIVKFMAHAVQRRCFAASQTGFGLL